MKGEKSSSSPFYPPSSRHRDPEKNQFLLFRPSAIHPTALSVATRLPFLPPFRLRPLPSPMRRGEEQEKGGRGQIFLCLSPRHSPLSFTNVRREKKVACISFFCWQIVLQFPALSSPWQN